MVVCVDCHRRCLNRCSGCGRPYCANCRNASGYTSCLKYCRTKKAVQKQASYVAQQQSQQVQSAGGGQAAYTPPPHLAQYANQPQGVVGAPPPSLPSPQPSGVPPQPLPSSRLMLYAMTDLEFAVWQQRTLDALHDTMSRGRAYLDRRRGRGAQTSTDITMERDQLLYQDLIAAIEEVGILREMATRDQQQHSGQTGMLHMYDTFDGKLRP